ncbi:probable aldo-keto reductase 1 isoform X2 [Syzygium oleosum]|uniref:probable aldo-keto reductase 1 isoform X2 n=1 Tax=Syzygium oleosum TaxID=219896 RepID=UPI0024BAAB2C|nr:probable aldo-keto reductase 1 isoform X2 [Syzygium oleosum]
MAGLEIPRVKLGNQGLEVSRLGFGCMSLSGIYNSPLSDEDGIAIIKDAYSKGITFFDTADAYGANANEVLVGKALKQLPRENIQLATKFGIVRLDYSNLVLNGNPEYVRSCCEASLKRLGVEYIDLYYQHRVDTSVPIEETMHELKKLVEEGKIKYIGLYEASPDTIRRAHRVHPITAVQMEWSLWTRDIEEEIVPLCRELGIGIVAYSPLGRGFFGGKAIVGHLSSVSSLVEHPRFKKENLNNNKIIYSRIEDLARKHRCSTAQLALAWLLEHGNRVVPIPGTTKIKNLNENIGSLRIKFTEEDLKDISEAVPINEVAGGRTYEGVMHATWKFANTPLPTKKY